MIKMQKADAGPIIVRSSRSSAPRLLCAFAVGIAVGFAMSSILVSHSFLEQDLFVKLKHATHHDVAQLEMETKSPADCPPQEAAQKKTLLQLAHDMELNSSLALELLRSAEEMNARNLASKVRVLCWVMTTESNHKDKAFHVKTTWGRHCNKLIFISDVADRELPSVKLNVPSDRKGLWAKTVGAFKYIHSKYKDDYDWVMKADDDTYVIVENLRSMLLPYSPKELIYFGFRFKPHAPLGYMSGGAGYIMSMAAVSGLVNDAFDGKMKGCADDKSEDHEDILIAECLYVIGARPGDSRDALGRNRFFPFAVEDHVNPFQGNRDWWYWEYVYWPVEGGLNCCSDQPVSFHYLTSTKMYMLEYLIYHVKPFGVMHLTQYEVPQHLLLILCSWSIMFEEKRNLILPVTISNNDRKSPLKGTCPPKIVFTFTLGLSIGFTLATLTLTRYSAFEKAKLVRSDIVSNSLYIEEDTSFAKNGLNISKKINKVFELKIDLNSTFVHELLKGSEEVAARRLAHEIRIVCLVLITTPKKHNDTIHVRDTWGRHCNNIHFISTQNDSLLPTTNVEIPPNRDLEWAKMEGSFKFLLKNRIDAFDWVVKTDQDTYIVVENLRKMVASHSCNVPIYFELNYELNQTSGLNSAAYVLSKEAVRQLVTNGFNEENITECNGAKNKTAKIGNCFKALAFKEESTLDVYKRRRCLPITHQNNLSDMQNQKCEWWNDDYVFWPMHAGLNCCSSEPVSFHLGKPTFMYMLEYLIYHVRPYSVIRRTRVKQEQFEAQPTEETRMILSNANKRAGYSGVDAINAKKLANEVRILCWVMTTEGNHKEKAFHVKTTWGRHCNKLIFMSDVEDLSLPSIKLDVKNDRAGLWAKTAGSFKYIYGKYKNDYDWVMKADDDTYVMVENLRAMLLRHSPKELIYFGYRFKPHAPLGYMSGGAGYVLSMEAVARLVNNAFDKNKKGCADSKNENSEDVNIAECLHVIGAKPGDSRDAQGRNRFFPFDVENHANPDQGKKDWWYWEYLYWPVVGGLNCCSTEPVSFHYIPKATLYMLEYLSYHVKPFGVMHLAKFENEH
ncbi:uncharacterized protein LOC132204077 [Neocloeon triangulifer]|uniref:uncharacterized protein LOC132204077 n=1 Tax=Neocloeon triangulifer TaxID=2078957 RepID=UPI00286F918C|nr:uncharacterized protein LOC132204077 [Neocloeon triangulifer]